MTQAWLRPVSQLFKSAVRATSSNKQLLQQALINTAASALGAPASCLASCRRFGSITLYSLLFRHKPNQQSLLACNFPADLLVHSDQRWPATLMSLPR